MILHQKSVIAIYKKNHVFAVGDEAFEMYEKAPENLEFAISQDFPGADFLRQLRISLSYWSGNKEQNGIFIEKPD